MKSAQNDYAQSEDDECDHFRGGDDKDEFY